MNLIYQVTDTQRLIVTAEANSSMALYRQLSSRQTEAGGVLMGRHLIDSENLVVDEVSTPQPKDKRGRFNFFRSKQHEAITNLRWHLEQGTSAYLGLWHTHPEDDPTPSSVDRADWERAITKDVFEGDRLFFPIVGREIMRIWTLTRNGDFKELERIFKNGKETE